MSDIAASVVIVTYNGELYLERLLTAVENQKFDGEVEVLVIDSGSTDRTLEIIAAHPEVILHEIPNKEFGHGKTRGLAVQMVRGEFVAFLTQDAIPDHDFWLAELLAPFAINERIAIVTGRQRPRKTAFPLQKYDIQGTFIHQGSETAISIFGNVKGPETEIEASAASFHSDVNAAVRRRLALGPLPFQDVRYSEDQLMAKEALAAGYWRAYAGRAVVEHSNDLTLHEYGYRMFDETVGLRQVGYDYPRMGLGEILVATLKGSIGDSIRIVLDDDFGPLQKIRWLFVNPLFQWRRWSRMRAASRVSLADTGSIRAGSLEHRRKSKD
jgi:rhamnosyltransferase